MGFNDQFAQQQSWAAYVRFGSKADIEAPPPDVRFTPESGHQLSALGCPLGFDDERRHPYPMPSAGTITPP